MKNNVISVKTYQLMLKWKLDGKTNDWFPSKMQKEMEELWWSIMTRVAKSVCVRDTWAEEPPVVLSPDLSNIYITN